MSQASLIERPDQRADTPPSGRREQISIRGRAHLLVTVRTLADSTGSASDQGPDITPVAGTDALARRGAPETIGCPVHDGGALVAWNDDQLNRVRLTRVDRNGNTIFDRCTDIPAARPHAGTPPNSQLAGLTLTAHGYALCDTHPRDDTANGEMARDFRVRAYDWAGRCLKEYANVLQPGTPPLHTTGQASGAWSKGGAMAGSTCRIAYGRGLLCLHAGHLMQWPDGAIVQGGFAKCLQISPTARAWFPGSTGEGTVVPWLASRSLDQRCTYDPYRRGFVLASLADGFPRGLLVSAIGADGFRSQTLQRCPGDPGSPKVGAELGGVVALAETYAVSYCSGVSAQPECRDVFVSYCAPDLLQTPMVIRVTRCRSGVYALNPKLARFGTNLLVAWQQSEPETGRLSHHLAIVSPHAQLVMEPIEVTDLCFAQTDDFSTDAQGCVNWFSSRDGKLSWSRLSYWRGTR